MGYFANSTEGLMYEGRYCERCVHWRENESGAVGCPVMDIHLVFNYEQFSKKEETKASGILTMLIPRDENGRNGECTMFLPVVPSVV